MTVRILGSQGRRNNPLGKRASIYSVGNKVLQPDNFPLGIVVYRNAVQSVTVNTWTNVSFNTAVFLPTTYGIPVMWSSGADVNILESGWYFLSASIGFDSAGNDMYIGFRFRAVNAALSLPGSKTYVQEQYYLYTSGHVVYYLDAGETIRLQVWQNYGTIDLRAGLIYSGLKIARLSG